jgi:hypothetical protein
MRLCSTGCTRTVRACFAVSEIDRKEGRFIPAFLFTVVTRIAVRPVSPNFKNPCALMPLHNRIIGLRLDRRYMNSMSFDINSIDSDMIGSNR